MRFFCVEISDLHSHYLADPRGHDMCIPVPGQQPKVKRGTSKNESAHAQVNKHLHRFDNGPHTLHRKVG